MTANILDPFGDFEKVGYLRNVYGTKNLEDMRRLEFRVFREGVRRALRRLKQPFVLDYEDLIQTHKILFKSLYPWAGQDRFITAPNIAIGKAGYKALFAHPEDVRRAAEYALLRGQDVPEMRAHPGEIFSYMAHAHPFLEGNGRTILTVYAELSRRANFHVRWEEIDKEEFLTTLTEDLLHPSGRLMDALVLRHVTQGVLTLALTADRLEMNFDRSVKKR